MIKDTNSRRNHLIFDLPIIILCDNWKCQWSLYSKENCSGVSKLRVSYEQLASNSKAPYNLLNKLWHSILPNDTLFPEKTAIQRRK